MTEYHENGSLFDYLSSRPVTHTQMLRMAASVAAGLAHLHLEIVGTQGKPGIAHRDLKSKNVLVKSDLSCAIADLGLCVRHVSSPNSLLDLPPPGGDRVGTARYLAPEILDGSIAAEDFDAWKRADVYSLGLILWELGRRTKEAEYDGQEYRQPYFDVVDADPSPEEMRMAVCAKKLRPDCPRQWERSPHLSVLQNVMRECWYENPAARLGPLQGRRTLSDALSADVGSNSFVVAIEDKLDLSV